MKHKRKSTPDYQYNRLVIKIMTEADPARRAALYQQLLDLSPQCSPEKQAVISMGLAHFTHTFDDLKDQFASDCEADRLLDRLQAGCDQLEQAIQTQDDQAQEQSNDRLLPVIDLLEAIAPRCTPSKRAEIEQILHSGDADGGL
jgi:hypothetical protein